MVVKSLRDLSCQMGSDLQQSLLHPYNVENSYSSSVIFSFEIFTLYSSKFIWATYLT